MTKKKLKEIIKLQDTIIEKYENIFKVYSEQNDILQELFILHAESMENCNDGTENLRQMSTRLAELLIDQTICEESKCEVGKMILELYQANKNSQSQEEID